MPRPGPRPYECVRRAWHTDRHKPVRGSLIQEIFRLVNEVHCSATRKNREWQEKLPIVVLKAEEIMYSKASSEAEYSDLKTLWDRVNDAINTIIRRDESSETGELLQPCIEAALHLGCTPRRSSRSQRNDCPSYLRPDPLEATSVSACFSDATPLMFHYPPPNLPRNSHDIKKVPVFHKNFTPSAPYNTSWSVYPLSYSNENQCKDPKFYPLRSSNEPGCHQQSPYLSKLDASGFVVPSFSHEGTSKKGQGVECDLTLRLGSLVGIGYRQENGSSASALEQRKPEF